jgi:hypothetical protein
LRVSYPRAFSAIHTPWPDYGTSDSLLFIEKTEYPHFRMPLTSTEREAFLVRGFFFGIVVAAYRKLWKAPGFWALLLAFLGVHTALYWLFIVGAAESFGGLRKDVFYGTVSGIEFVTFALIIARLYHRGPNIRFL